MPAFQSPIGNPSGAWTITETTRTIPSGLRFGGYALRGVTFSGGAGNVVAPALGVLNTATDDDGKTVVEVQVNPFPIRQVASQFARGLPTFYFVFDSATPAITVGHTAAAGEIIAAPPGNDVSLVIAMQDRTSLSVALAIREIRNTVSAGGGTVPADFDQFLTVVENQTSPSASAPIYLYDQAGRPLRDAEIRVVYGGAGTAVDHTVNLVDADNGDLQAAFRRLNTAGTLTVANLWADARYNGTSAHLRVTPQARHQLVRIEDGTAGAGEIEISPTQRHVALVDLHDWFAAQGATPSGASGPSMMRFHRGCKIAPLVNGMEFFDDLFEELYKASQATSGGFHLAGWAMFPDTELIERPAGQPDAYPISLKQATQLLSAVGGCRYLPAGFFDLHDLDTVAMTEQLIVLCLVATLLILACFEGVSLRTDGSGAVVLLILLLANPSLFNMFLGEDAAEMEPNKGAVDELDGLTNTACKMSHYPAHINDNPECPATSGFPFSTLFTVTRHFGVYHQKFCVLRSDSDYIGYCGGIDLNPDRLDDESHLAKQTPSLMPYHDVHLRIEGPAVSDLAKSFEERWDADGSGGLAFATPAANSLGSPGDTIVQVARTYFEPGTPGASHRLDFAPAGDRTLLDTMLKAIDQAREFIFIEDQYLTPGSEFTDALAAKVASGDIKKLIVAVPGLTDQPFGEKARTDCITQLKASDASGKIVTVGAPRRRYTVPQSDLRVSSGRMRLMADLANTVVPGTTIALGPVSRVPEPPFWVAVGGELIWCHDDAGTSGSGATAARLFHMDRGADTCILVGGGSPKGASTRKHEAGAPATVVELTHIYVHAKLIIVDDVFLGVGSANLNRRGFYHDGEMNCYCLPQSLRYDAGNPVAALRCRLWAELLDLPAAMAQPLLRDPLAASKLFERSYFQGNRFVPIDASPTHSMWGMGGGEAIVGFLVTQAINSIVIASHTDLYDAAVDPTSNLDQS